MIMAYKLWKPQIQNLRKFEYCKKVQNCRLKVSHSNQLINPKHRQRVPEPLNGLSVWSIMGKTADLTVVQKTIIDTLHKEGKPQKVIAKEVGCSQSAVSKHINRKLSGREKCGRKRCTKQQGWPQPGVDCQEKAIQKCGGASQRVDWGWSSRKANIVYNVRFRFNTLDSLIRSFSKTDTEEIRDTYFAQGTRAPPHPSQGVCPVPETFCRQCLPSSHLCLAHGSSLRGLSLLAVWLWYSSGMTFLRKVEFSSERCSSHHVVLLIVRTNWTPITLLQTRKPLHRLKYILVF